MLLSETCLLAVPAMYTLPSKTAVQSWARRRAEGLCWMFQAPSTFAVHHSVTFSKRSSSCTLARAGGCGALVPGQASRNCRMPVQTHRIQAAHVGSATLNITSHSRHGMLCNQLTLCYQ